MAKLHKKIIDALRSHLRDVEDALDDLPGGRVSGVIVSSSFNALSHQARQDKLYAILQRELTPAELSAVGAIAALTPAEAKVKAG
jgi:acid stress-induced BolA-like protein IbaG/YrbA